MIQRFPESPKSPAPAAATAAPPAITMRLA